MVAEKMEKLAKASRTSIQKEAGEGDFVAGLNPKQIDAVPKEEEKTFEELAQQTTEEVREMIAEANNQAEQILKEARVQAETIKNRAKDMGYAEGLRDGTQKMEEELQQKNQQLVKERHTLLETYRQKVDELEPQLVEVITDVFKKVFQVEFQDKSEVLSYLIQNTIQGIESTKEFLIRVSSEDYPYLNSHKEEIVQRVGQSATVEIMTDNNMKKGQCIIETDSGVFDCGTEVQLEHLIKTIRSLSL